MKFTFNPFDLDDEELSSIVHKRLRLDESEDTQQHETILCDLQTSPANVLP